jgi:hypothetical protein
MPNLILHHFADFVSSFFASPYWESFQRALGHETGTVAALALLLWLGWKH